MRWDAVYWRVCSSEELVADVVPNVICVKPHNQKFLLLWDPVARHMKLAVCRFEEWAEPFSGSEGDGDDIVDAIVDESDDGG